MDWSLARDTRGIKSSLHTAPSETSSSAPSATPWSTSSLAHSTIPSTASSSRDDAYIVEYRSLRSRDYKKTVTSRRNAVVHNEHARGYDSLDPRPQYGQRQSRHNETPACTTGNDQVSRGDSRAAHSLKTRHGNLQIEGDPSKCPESSTPMMNDESSTEIHAALSTLTVNIELLGRMPSQPHEGKQVQQYEGLASTSATSSVQSPPSPTTSNTSGCQHVHHQNNDTKPIITKGEPVGSSMYETQSLLSRGGTYLPQSSRKSFSLGQQGEATKPPRPSVRDSLLTPAPYPSVLTFTEFLDSFHIPTADPFRTITDLALRRTYHPNQESETDKANADLLLSPVLCSSEDPRSDHAAVVFSSQRRSENQNPEAHDPSDRSSVSNSSYQSRGTCSTMTAPTTFAPSVASAGPAMMPLPVIGAGMLPCEFISYAACNEWYDAEDTYTWTQHVIVDHLHHKIPSVCCCWFCDDIRFDANESKLDRMTNFLNRMDHIRQHIVEDGFTIHNIRPDFPFLKHLHKNGFIEQSTFDAAMGWTEGPKSRVAGLYPHDFVPPEQLRRYERSQVVIVDQQKEDRQLMKQRRHKTVSQARDQTLRSKNPHQTTQRHGHKLRKGSTETDAHQPCCSSDDSQKKKTDDDSRPLTPVSQEEPQESSSRIQGTDFTANEQDLQGELYIRLGRLTISDNNTNEAAPRVETVENITEASDAVDEFLSDDFQSLVSARSSGRNRSSNSSERASAESPRDRVDVEGLIGTLRPQTQYHNKGVRERVTAPNSRRISNATSSSGDQSASYSSSSKRPGRPGKRQRLSKGSDDEESEEEPEQDQASSPKGKENEQRPFACPYIKRNKARYGVEPVCRNHSWPNVLRVRQHLYRKHKKPDYYCSRCCGTFKDHKALTDHQRMPTPCELGEEEPTESLDASQENQLKAIKTFKNMDECARWRKVYMILFPDVTEDLVPSPYHDQEEYQLPEEIESTMLSALVEEMAALQLNVNHAQLQEMCKRVVEKSLKASSQSAHPSIEPQSPEAHRADQCSGIAQDSTQDPDQQVNTSASESTSTSNTTGTELNPTSLTDNDPLGIGLDPDDLVWDLLWNAIPSANQGDPSVNHLAGMNENQQHTEARKSEADSGYGSMMDTGSYT